MTRRFCFCCFVILMAVSTVYAQPKGWKAGVSSVVITPEQPMWMAGYADRNHPSEGKLVDIWAKALVLEDAQGKRVVMVSAELVGIPQALSNHIRGELQKKYRLEKADIMLNSSHTHSGPVLTAALVDIYPVNVAEQQKIDSYTNRLGEKIIALVGSAIKALQPAQVFAGNGVTRFQVNRRNNEEAKIASLTELKGPNDYAVPVIKVTNATGKLTAIAFGYACHNTVLNGYKYSGDYSGFAQLDLERAYPGATALFFQGCGANQNPLPRRTVALAKQYGQELAAAVTRVLSEDMRALPPTVLTAYTEMSLPLAPPPSAVDINKMAAGFTAPYQKRWADRMLKKIAAGDSLPSVYPYPVQVWKVGNQPIFTLGGEVVIDYAISLKKIFGPQVFVFGYSNDVMAYIPSLAILREGGYEGSSSQLVYGLPGDWHESIETLIVQQATLLARQVEVPLAPLPIK